MPEPHPVPPTRAARFARTARRLAGATLLACAGAHAGPLTLEIGGNLGHPRRSAQSRLPLRRSRAARAARRAHRDLDQLDAAAHLARAPPRGRARARAGAHGSAIKVYAYDDYREEIPMALITRYHPILAYSGDGKRLALSDFGPLFIVFPRDQYPGELSGVTSQRRFVFHVRRIDVKP
ncbi:hypothetical protein Bsp3421_003165 [Burkholderia sp. FERM BP-3421]|uniref:hypothetical protein n=1 Tax=Burkholderia sp. FERM BP-3421 TaxID=1494466 RepID=UPI00235E3457|nr:hypothetical protein [Burkholderia sp. FERM BP-3421]WDD93112.1 hypothetical protein Bsp3421_003165 [Burkholderia sp. FERM BP-3421]